MALRNQPYFPLYVQDYLTDEKLNECTAAAQGIYIKMLCIMHKCEPYGTILLKQKDKQTDKQILNFAIKFGRNLPFTQDEILSALTELISEQVFLIEGDKLIQPRMVKDNNISEIRSMAGKRGGFANSFAKAKLLANTEYENENTVLNVLPVLNNNGTTEKKQKAKPKNQEEVCNYFAELELGENEAAKFFDYYTANGWKVGKNSMKDWRAAARNWKKNLSSWVVLKPQKKSELEQWQDLINLK